MPPKKSKKLPNNPPAQNLRVLGGSTAAIELFNAYLALGFAPEDTLIRIPNTPASFRREACLCGLHALAAAYNSTRGLNEDDFVPITPLELAQMLDSPEYRDIADSEVAQWAQNLGGDVSPRLMGDQGETYHLRTFLDLNQLRVLLAMLNQRNGTNYVLGHLSVNTDDITVNDQNDEVNRPVIWVANTGATALVRHWIAFTRSADRFDDDVVDALDNYINTQPDSAQRIVQQGLYRIEQPIVAGSVQNRDQLGGEIGDIFFEQRAEFQIPDGYLYGYIGIHDNRLGLVPEANLFAVAEVAARTWSSRSTSAASPKKTPPPKKAVSPKKNPPDAAPPKKPAPKAAPPKKPTPKAAPPNKPAPKAAAPKNKQKSGNTPPVPSKPPKAKKPKKKQNGKTNGAVAAPQNDAEPQAADAGAAANGAEPQAADAGAAANASKPKVAGAGPSGKKGNNKKRGRDDDDQENADNRPSKKSKTKAIGPGKPLPNWDDKKQWPIANLRGEVEWRLKNGSNKKKPDMRSYDTIRAWLKEDDRDRAAKGKAVAEEEEGNDEVDDNDEQQAANAADQNQDENDDDPPNRDYKPMTKKNLEQEVDRRNARGRNIDKKKLRLKKDWLAALRRDDRDKDKGS